MMSGIKLENLGKRWGSFVAVNDVSLEVEDGEFVVLLGPSGCGKTTTMRLIAGLEHASEGNIHIGKRRVNDVDPGQRNVAMVFQNHALFPHMTVRNNLAFPLKAARIPKSEHERLIRETVATVGLSDLLDRKPAQLSGGQRQRVALGRALIRRPDVFLMDEPLSNLDAVLRQSMRAELKSLHQRLGITTIFVTHDQVEAMTLATRIAIMKDGRLQQFDTPGKIFDDPSTAFVAEFVGSPAMNLVMGEFLDGTFISRAFSKTFGTDFAGPAILGVRPSNLRICGGAEACGSARICSIETTGEQSIVTLRDGAQLINISETRGENRKVGDEVFFNLEAAKCVFFDVESKARIWTRP